MGTLWFIKLSSLIFLPNKKKIFIGYVTLKVHIDETELISSQKKYMGKTKNIHNNKKREMKVVLFTWLPHCVQWRTKCDCAAFCAREYWASTHIHAMFMYVFHTLTYFVFIEDSHIHRDHFDSNNANGIIFSLSQLI